MRSEEQIKSHLKRIESESRKEWDTIKTGGLEKFDPDLTVDLGISITIMETLRWVLEE